MGTLNRWKKRQLWRLEEGRRGSKLDLWIIFEGGGAADLMVEGGKRGSSGQGGMGGRVYGNNFSKCPTFHNLGEGYQQLGYCSP